MPDTRSVTEILRAAKSRIEDRHHWTRYRPARDRHSHGVTPTDDRAVRWCAAGSFICEGAGLPEPTTDLAWNYLLQVIDPGDSVSWINDALGHKAVLEMFDRAIALAEAAQ